MQPITMNCPGCNVRLKVSAEVRGKRVKCPRCPEIFEVPDGTVEVVEPTGNTQPLVFVSHSRHDRAFVQKKVKPALESAGYRLWWSHEDIPGGGQWNQEIRRVAQEADWFLLVMSPEAAQSDWVKTEVNWAYANKPDAIIPVMCRACPLEAFHSLLPEKQYVDFTQDEKTAARRLIQALTHQLHTQARENKMRVEELSKQLEAMKEAWDDSESRCTDLQRRVLSVREFDGTYTRPAVNSPPAFRPLRRGKAPIIAVLNLKGGVGKTTLTANLGASLWGREPKRKVLLVDLDYQANLSLGCIGEAGREWLARRPLLQGLYSEGAHPDLALQAERILDDNQRATLGSIVPCDANLLVEETRALTRWLIGDSKKDLRFLLREALHREAVQEAYQYILLDCPPRLTPSCINALTACDYLLVPVILDERSTEGPPQLLAWIWANRDLLDLRVRSVGLIANKTKGPDRNRLVGREQNYWEGLVENCEKVWGGMLHPLNTVVPLFNERGMERRFAANFADFGPIFARAVQELTSHFFEPAGVAP